MFFPYFRGRQVELLALRDLEPKLAKKKKICPIIEPVMANTRDLKAFLTTAKGNFPHAVLINPAVGELIGKVADIEALIAPFLALPGTLLVPGFHVGPTTTLAQVNAFLAKYGKFQALLVFDRPSAALHGMGTKLSSVAVSPFAVFIEGKVSPSFINSFSAFRKVLIRGGFIAQPKNAMYPPLDFFSDLHKTYVASGYFGFGDFNIVEDVYSPGGGPAHAVAIHLTELNTHQEIYTNHFVSNRTTGNVDTPGKFLEALTKLAAHVLARPRSFSYSLACQEFQDLYVRRHYPGLPSVKRLSMRHHLELMETIV